MLEEGGVISVKNVSLPKAGQAATRERISRCCLWYVERRTRFLSEERERESPSLFGSREQPSNTPQNTRERHVERRADLSTRRVTNEALDDAPPRESASFRFERFRGASLRRRSSSSSRSRRISWTFRIRARCSSASCACSRASPSATKSASPTTTGATTSRRPHHTRPQVRTGTGVSLASSPSLERHTHLSWGETTTTTSRETRALYSVQGSGARARDLFRCQAQCLLSR